MWRKPWIRHLAKLVICISFLTVVSGAAADDGRAAFLEPVSIAPVAGAALSGNQASDERAIRVEMFGRVMVFALEDSGVVGAASSIVEIGDDGVAVEGGDTARHYRG